MKLKTIYIIEGSKFGKAIEEWAIERGIVVESKAHRNGELREFIKGVVIFHENHHFSREDLETEEILGNNNIPTHKVDIDGTVAATRSNLLMWLDNNNPENILLLGADNIENNPHFQPFFEGIR